MPVMSLVVSSGAVILTALILASASAAIAGTNRKPVPAPAKRDCTPINGRFGYYGNPWCDTGSYRLEDLEFRERQAQQRSSAGCAKPNSARARVFMLREARNHHFPAAFNTP